MASHGFNQNLPLQNNEQEYLFDLNKSPTRETSQENCLGVPLNQEQEDFSYINSDSLLA
ncbi:unnamed protein product [Arabidopsis halleri]